MTELCRASIEERRHDEAEMERAKDYTPVTVEELIGSLKDMEVVVEGLGYLNKAQEAELLDAIQKRDLTEVGRIVVTGAANMLAVGIANGYYVREGE